MKNQRNTHQEVNLKKETQEHTHSLARKNNWLNEMIWFEPSQKMKPNGYWTKDRVFEESKKYKTFKEFKKGSIGAYLAAKNMVGLMK